MAKAFPRILCFQEPGDRVTVTLDRRTVFSYHFGQNYPRPFLYPLITPQGHNVLAYGHSNDLVGHSHHRGIFIGHQSVNEKLFWADRDNRCVHQRLLKLEDGIGQGIVSSLNYWMVEGAPVLDETRTFTVDAKGALLVTLEFVPHNADVKLGMTKFGFLAVRVAKTIGVTAGGGKITDSTSRVNEKAVYGQTAAWCDYSGPISAGNGGGPDVWAGLTIHCDSKNPRHPTPWMCRDDGWFSPAFNMIEPFTISKKEKLTLRYRLVPHDGDQPASSNA